MNTNLFYKELFEDRLGLDILGLESRYKEFVKLVNRTTLTTFANYIPCYYTYYFNLDEDTRVATSVYQRFIREYEIRDGAMEKYNLPVLDVVRIDMLGMQPVDPEIDGYYSSVIASQQVMDIESILIGAENTYMDTIVNNAVPFKRTFDLLNSRVLALRNYPTQGVAGAVIKTKFPNIASVPEEYKETLLELASLDLKARLYPELRYMMDVVTPVGNLDLRVSDWDSAQGDRKSFLEDLRRQSFPDRVNTYYFQIM